MITSPAGDPIADALRQALGSQYEVLGLVGRGGMGVVYRAREPFLERDVAVKVLSQDAASGNARERFLREARTAARLSHPNIVPLYTFGQAGELLYYVMGYVEGESLEDRLKREQRLPLDDARRILSELADALDYAHKLGVVHRDVKPDNVLLDRNTGRAMLTDFGIAKQRAGAATLTQTGVIVGTPHYMSPEQAAGERDADGRSDIYSLGIIGYRMTTGRLPFEGKTFQEVLAQHATVAPISPRELAADVTPSLEHAIVRALAKDPSARWPSAGSMQHALTSEGEGTLPESLENITGMGPRVSLISLGLMQLAFVGGRFGWMDMTLSVAAGGSAAAMALVGLTGLIGPARRHGFRAAWRQFWLQPSWWSTWWPRFGRRAGDVWDRLPADVRRIRTVTGLGMASNVVLLNALFYGMSNDMLVLHPGYMTVYSWIAIGAVATWMGVLIPAARRFVKHAKALGITMPEIRQMQGGQTWGAFWQRTHVAATLNSGPARDARAFGDSPTELARHIRALADGDPTSLHAELYREAATAAAAIHAAIQALDAEIAQLARESDPRELERIQESIGALGQRDVSESAAKSQMRELLERQAALFRDILSHRDQLAARRAHLVEQLRTLALHLANLRAAALPTTVSDITSRIRTICRELEYRAAGEREVRAVT